MGQAMLTTHFLPAERDAPDEIARQARHFLEAPPPTRDVLDAVPDYLMALNLRRQIVFANRSLLDFLHADEAALLGLRAGEALDCLHSDIEVAGCGTSEFCATCGAARAIMASRAGAPSVQECRITRHHTAEALDFRVWATPLALGGEVYTIFALTDISHEKRRRALERIFFHDVLNTATAMRASSDMLKRAGPESYEHVSGIVTRLVERLIEEVLTQRQLLEAESDELEPSVARVEVLSLVEELVASYEHHEVARERCIRVEAPEERLWMATDGTLLRRVLGNLLKNALEASRSGDTVTVGARQCPGEAGDGAGGIEFWVHNPAHMPREVQLQVFKRSFSTKGSGRGLGTYSVRLLTERYLGGRVSFTSMPGEGTTFVARYPMRLEAH